jgi:prepilin-type N-terminal cleavage/methylation domain-containing protein
VIRSDIRQRLLRDERGFTLVEMMVTIIIMIVVLSALYSIFDMSVRVFTFGSNKVEAMESARLGHLTQASKFQGIILTLHGDGSAFGSTNCAGNDVLGTYTNAGQDCQCWMYADGGTATTAGITLRHNSKIFFYSGDWSFLSDLFEGPPPTSFALQGWRELYE